jgi:hypothetical protein
MFSRNRNVNSDNARRILDGRAEDLIIAMADGHPASLRKIPNPYWKRRSAGGYP